MITYRYYHGKGNGPSPGADAEQIFKHLADLLLHENNLDKSLDLLKRQGVKERGKGFPLKGVQDFLEEVRRRKRELEDSMISSNPSKMEDLKRLEKLENELRRASWGLDLDKVNPQAIQEILGEEGHELWKYLSGVPRLLEIEGFIEKQGSKFTLTPKGMRRIGGEALQSIFASLKRDAMGDHEIHFHGDGLNLRLEESRPYRFGDPLHLNLGQTFMNTLQRQGHSSFTPGRKPPLTLHPEDFEVFQTEKRVRSSVVLMLDMSGSMARDEKFFAAKKVALALHTLMQSHFPQDRLHLLGFSSYARVLKIQNLPYLSWDLDNPYTNMEEGLLLAKSLLQREHTPNKQIILVSDGEPTAHLEGAKVFFQFPPHAKTLAKTMRMFQKCASCGIHLNIFMLSREAQRIEFIQQILRLNRGRVFYTTPHSLGKYLLVDFLSMKCKWITP